MGGRERLVEQVGARGSSYGKRPPPKLAPAPTSTHPPGYLAPAPRPGAVTFPVQVIPRPRCPRCGSRDVWVHRTEGDLRHYHCRAGCLDEGAPPGPAARSRTAAGPALRFKVRMV